jgi:hypothetical protein
METRISALGTIMGIWAHPDDEAYLSGGPMALARANGQRVVCVTATPRRARYRHPVPAGRPHRVQPGVRDPSVSTGMIPAGRGVTLCGRPRGRRGGERFRLWMSIKGKRAEEDDDDLVNQAS